VRETVAAMPLDELRKGRRMPQNRLAENLGVKQGETSKIERRTDDNASRSQSTGGQRPRSPKPETGSSAR